MTMTVADIERTLPLLTDRERAEIDRLVNGALPFGAFVRDAWSVLEPTTVFVPNWHIDAIAEHLEALADRQIRKLLINIPPRCMKSLLVSVFWPSWEWATNQTEKYLAASYGSDLSQRDTLKRQLDESLDEIDAFTSLPALVGQTADTAPPTTNAAFEVWSATELARSRLTLSDPELATHRYAPSNVMPMGAVPTG